MPSTSGLETIHPQPLGIEFLFAFVAGVERMLVVVVRLARQEHAAKTVILCPSHVRNTGRHPLHVWRWMRQRAVRWQLGRHGLDHYARRRPTLERRTELLEC